MTQKNSEERKKEPGIGRTVMDDLRRDGLTRSMRRDFNEMKEFYLTEERHAPDHDPGADHRQSDRCQRQSRSLKELL